MKIVIQCAATKRATAGHLRSADGRRVVFVARPELAPSESDVLYAHPDEETPDGETWRDAVMDLNRPSSPNVNGLLPAIELYSHPIYGRLAESFGWEHVFILSAGWGLIPANFLTPAYDITFSRAEPWKRRSGQAAFNDLSMLDADESEPIVFLGGVAYLPLFSCLTASARGGKIVFYNSENPPFASTSELRRYETRRRTNWHYGCAADLISGLISI